MSPATLIARLEAVDIDGATQADLQRAGGLVRQLRGFLASVDGQIARRATELHDIGRSIPPEDLLAKSGSSSRREAQRARRRSEVLGDAPHVDEQLAKGRISTEHIDALANAAHRLPTEQRAAFLDADDELAASAASMSPERFRRHVNRLADQMSADDGIERSERQRAAAYLTMGVVEETGMGYIRGELHPEDFQRVRRAIDGEVAALRTSADRPGLRTEQLNALALVNVTTGARSVAARNRAEVAVLTDYATFVGGPHPDTVCEYSDGTPVPVATMRRLACDAGIVPVVLGGDGLPLDVGRARRLATPEQRTALRAMYRTCAVDGCDRDFDHCEIHHLLEWIDTGPTDLANLLPVCSHHHHRAHEGRWRLELDPHTRELSVWLPNGTLLSRCLPDLVAERMKAAPVDHAA